MPDRYDDCRLSGCTLERPSLQELLSAIEDTRIDQMWPVRSTALPRSISDFAKIANRLEALPATFVLAAQNFITGTYICGLNLNTLLSFASFEREMTAERMRDKKRRYKAQKAFGCAALCPWAINQRVAALSLMRQTLI